MSERGMYTHEVVTHEIDQNLFMTRSGKIVEGNFEVGDSLVVMHSDIRPLPVYKTRIDPLVEEPPIRKLLKSGARIVVTICKTPVEIQYDTSEMDCGETQDLTAVGCNGPYVWELVEGGGPVGGELAELEDPREDMTHTESPVDPTVDDDETKDYKPWSRWHNTTTDKYFVCVDESEGAAVWIEYKAPPDGGLGDQIRYIAPNANPNCEHNAKITVQDYYKSFPDPPGYPTEAELEINIQCYHLSDVAYHGWRCWTFIPYTCRLGPEAPTCIRFICGYDEYDCEGTAVGTVVVDNIYVNKKQFPPPPGLPDWCGNDINNCEQYMGGLLYGRVGGTGDCVPFYDFCAGHFSGEYEDVRTPQMLLDGCCPHALM